MFREKTVKEYLILVFVSIAFLTSCSNEPEFERFGFWVKAQDEKIEIQKVEYNPFFSNTGSLIKDAIGISLNGNDKPTFYYYGDIPASTLKFIELHSKEDLNITFDVIPLKQSGAYKIIPGISLKTGEYYVIFLASNAYVFQIKEE